MRISSVSRTHPTVANAPPTRVMQVSRPVGHKLAEDDLSISSKTSGGRKSSRRERGRRCELVSEVPPGRRASKTVDYDPTGSE